jgi:two-component system cell cycle sensor histidine kinase/response regulator CckA
VTDTTSRRKAEESQKKLEEQLLRAQRMESVGRLAGGIAHDFNNMLSVILGNVELAMASADTTDTLGGVLLEIQTAAQHSAELTRQLLAFARKQTVVPKVLDLNEMVDGMLKMLKRLIGEHITLSWRPCRDLGRVKIDPSQIDQILANLCVNARDAIEGIGEVAIGTANIEFDEGYCAEHTGSVPGE